MRPFHIGTTLALYPHKYQSNPRKEIRKMKKTWVALSLVAIVMMGVSLAYAQGPGFGRGFGKRGDCAGPCGDSSLSAEQKGELQQLRKKFFDETASLRETIRSTRFELRTLWTDAKANPEAIQAKEKELRELQNQMKDKMVQFRLEARNHLTDEQLSQFGACGGGRGGRGPGLGRGCN
jgi:Spy/CpxP family protein refolding chaperone